jgi:hypothetical protein
VKEMSGNDERPDGLRLREERHRLLEQLATERGHYHELEMAIIHDAEDMAAAIIETTMSAIIASREVYNEYLRELHNEHLRELHPTIFRRLWRWIRDVWK